MISNLPATRSINPVLTGTETASIANQVRTSLDMNVFSFTLGPTLGRSWDDFHLAFQGGVIVNVYDWEGRQTERLTATSNNGTSEVARWADGDSGTKFRPGLYAQADAYYDLGNDFALGGYPRLETAAEFRAEAGPTTFKIDPSGFSGGLMVRYTLP